MAGGLKDRSANLQTKALGDLQEPLIEQAPLHSGHRHRLKQRFLSGHPDAMPDYELLELLLFGGIPRRDTSRPPSCCWNGSARSPRSSTRRPND
jgi:hypothetical protein